MSIELRADRRMRLLLWRTIGCRLMVLIFLLPLNAGAWREEGDALVCGTGKLSTYIGGMVVAKNIVISYSQKQEPSVRAADYFTSCHLVWGGDLFSLLSWPYCRYCRLPWLVPPLKGAIGNDVTYSVVHGS